MQLDYLDYQTINQFLMGKNADPFAILGMQVYANHLIVSTYQPDALSVTLLNRETKQVVATLNSYHDSGFFSILLTHQSTPFPYLFHVQWQHHEAIVEDPYRFGVLLNEYDSYLLAEGTHLRSYQRLGAHPTTLADVDGICFSVWAPNAQRVAVIGEFNFWDSRRNPMRFRQETGIWELFIPHLHIPQRYKYQLIDCHGQTRYKSDPYAFVMQSPPDMASVITTSPVSVKPRRERSVDAFQQPMSIYEVHLGSWRRHHDNRWLTYYELADQLIPYVKEMGFTHLELLPISEHPFSGSWGYQPMGLYAPTQRFGDADGLHYFISRAHQADIKVLLDWVPAHFPQDETGLKQFDGSALYEYADPREGLHYDWHTLVYNYRRHEVKNYLLSNALYWLEVFDFDGLRVDAVSSMLYRDYSRLPDQWIPNHYGGNENLEAIAFLQAVNQTVNQQYPDVTMIAEESTDFFGVTLPPQQGGLGFHYKWNMGWMHDTLRYMALDPIYRQYHHELMTFGLLYAYQENYVLPLSHDEVVHGKGSLLSKMFGHDESQKFASLRAYYGFMWAYPGKKLLFMGGEFAQKNEWNHDIQLDWHLLLGEQATYHHGVQQLVKALNYCYRQYPPLYQCDHQPTGFQWLVVDDCQNAIFVFLRRDQHGNDIIVICNFTAVGRQHYCIGVPQAGLYREILNTDSHYFGGTNQGNMGVVMTQMLFSHGFPQALSLYLPPLTTLYLIREA